MLDLVAPRPIHPFPARMAASVAWNELRASTSRLTVLDPMAGSGTSLAVAARLGHRAHGVDVDPLAVLAAGVWTSGLDVKALRRASRRVLKSARRSPRVPRFAEAETASFVKYWFDAVNRRQLAALAAAISRVRDERVRNGLWCAFSRMIITKQGGVSCAMDLAHSRPHKVREVAAVQAFDVFLAKVDQLSTLLPGALPGNASVRLGDARKLPFTANSVDRVITSPPYLNAIDYLRTSKFTLVWMGYTISSLRSIRARSIGTEVAGTNLPQKRVTTIVDRMISGGVLSTRRKRIVANYVRDLDAVISEVARVLRPTGAALFVVGESTTKGVLIRNSRAVSQLARLHGLRVVSTRRRKLPPNRRYLPPPSAAGKDLVDRRMAYEVLIRIVPTAIKAR